MPALALSITFENQGGFEVGTPALAALNEAASLWQSIMADNVSIRVAAKFADIAGAFAYPSGQEYGYANVREALVRDQTSLLDVRAVSNLERGQSFSFIVDPVPDTGARDPQQQGYRLQQGGASPMETTLFVGNANAKALGLTPTLNTALDGGVVFSNTEPFQFNRSNGIAQGKVDFVGVAAHELGHVLGFTSGVDQIDLALCPRGPLCGYETLTSLRQQAVFTPLDLYRYSPSSRELTLQLGVPVRDLSVTAIPFGPIFQSRFFSETQGATALGQFATGEFHGNGNQASHWKNGTSALMAPGVLPGVVWSYSILDLFAFDAIGWDVRPFIPVGAPEPNTLLLIGSGLFGLGRWRRRQVRSMHPAVR